MDRKRKYAGSYFSNNRVVVYVYNGVPMFLSEDFWEEHHMNYTEFFLPEHLQDDEHHVKNTVLGNYFLLKVIKSKVQRMSDEHAEL